VEVKKSKIGKRVVREFFESEIEFLKNEKSKLKILN
jgi:hypothetical protein